MKLHARLKKLDTSLPKCDGRITRVVVGEHRFTEADRYRRCAGCHVLVLKRKIVSSRDLIVSPEQRP